MLVVNVRAEKTLPALVDRITKAGISATARTRVESAILAANPGLDARRLKRGDVVRVPPSPDLLKSARRAGPTDRADIFEQLSELVNEWRATAETTDDVATAERADLERVVRDRSLKKAAERNDDLAATLKKVSLRNREEGTRAKAATRARAQRLEEMAAGLEAMRARTQ